jgi:hypothetical protein
MVVGQVIDYAAALREGGSQGFVDAWAKRGGSPLADVLDIGAEARLKATIDAGEINLCLAVDQIDDDLRRMVEYLNEISKEGVGITALQLSYARHGSLEMLIPVTFGAEIASAKRPRADFWTWDDFVMSLGSRADRQFAEELRLRMESVEALGTTNRMWFGRKPGGKVFFHLHGLRYAAISLGQSSGGELRVFGNWRTWPSLRSDPRFEELASVLGQSYLEGRKGVAASGLDLDVLWKVALDCDLSINDRC